MQTTITKSVAEKAKPKDKPYRIYDTLLPGFSLRVQPTGRKSWVLEVQRKTRTLGRYPSMTVAMAREKARRIINGDEEVKEPSSIPTLDTFINDYYREYLQAHQSRPREAEALINNIGMGKKLLDDIKIADVEKYRTRRLKAGIKASTLNRQIGALKAALQKAVDWELLADHPLQRFKPLKVDNNSVVRFLSKSEEIRLTAQLVISDPWVKAFAITALNTGLRRGELWKLTWADVDLKKRMLVVHGGMAKSKQTRHVPLNQTAVDHLTIWRGAAVPMKNLPVFGQREFKKSWATILKKCGVENFRFHDCRHHFASKLVIAGVPLNTVRELLGHGDMKMTLRYAHLSPDNMREAVELIG